MIERIAKNITFPLRGPMSRTRTITTWIVAPLLACIVAAATAFEFPGDMTAHIWIMLILVALAVMPAMVLTLRRWNSRKAEGWRPAAFIFLAAALMAYLAMQFLARYWAFYRLGAPGSGFYLVHLFFPAMMLGASAIGLWLYTHASLRPGETTPSLMRAMGGVVLLILIVVSAEVVSTASERGGEGLGAGDLHPFLTSLFTRPTARH